MIFAVFSLAVLVLVYGPSLWVTYVLRRHSKSIEAMPGTGGELAEHLVEQFKLAGVKVVRGKPGEDFYSPDNKIVSLSPNHYDKKSLSAVAVAAHEIGHAIQFCREEPVSLLRKKYMGRVAKIRRIGGILLTVAPIAMVLSKAPLIMGFFVGVGILTMLFSVLMYVAILPEEFDASFNKALPILSSGYLPENHLPAARQILKACALTYVAGALTDVLNLWRWIRFFR